MAYFDYTCNTNMEKHALLRTLVEDHGAVTVYLKLMRPIDLKFGYHLIA